MCQNPKIKIMDDDALRSKINALCDQADQVTLAKWSLALAENCLRFSNIAYEDNPIIMHGIKTNELWQSSRAHMHDVRQAGFEIHRLARACKDEVQKAALRTAGQAVSSAHMKQHSIVASDYAVKAMNLLCPNDLRAVSALRQWQLDTLKIFIDDKDLDT